MTYCIVVAALRLVVLRGDGARSRKRRIALLGIGLVVSRAGPADRRTGSETGLRIRHRHHRRPRAALSHRRGHRTWIDPLRLASRTTGPPSPIAPSTRRFSIEPVTNWSRVSTDPDPVVACSVRFTFDPNSTSMPLDPLETFHAAEGSPVMDVRTTLTERRQCAGDVGQVDGARLRLHVDRPRAGERSEDTAARRSGAKTAAEVSSRDRTTRCRDSDDPADAVNGHRTGTSINVRGAAEIAECDRARLRAGLDCVRRCRGRRSRRSR